MSKVVLMTGLVEIFKSLGVQLTGVNANPRSIMMDPMPDGGWAVGLRFNRLDEARRVHALLPPDVGAYLDEGEKRVSFCT